MNKKVRKAIKISGITLGAVLVLFLAAVTIVINFVFTPKKLTPVVVEMANESLNAHLHIESVDLTFFSTFPRFGLRVKDGALVSKALNDTNWTKTDSLLSFKECVLTVDPLAYVLHNKITVYNLSLENASVYAFRNKEGIANWDVMKASAADTAQTDTTQMKLKSEVDIRNIELKHANLIFDDRDTRVYSRIDDANLKLRLSLTKGISELGLKFDNKNILFWQDGELLVNKIAASLQTDVAVDRRTRLWTLKNTALNLNGIELAVAGTLQRDTVAKTIDMNLTYGLDAPSMETVLGMIPKAYVKENQVSAKGHVNVSGEVKGLYGDKKLPTVTLKIAIKEASAQYAGLPYGIDELTADFDAYVDLMRKKPSYMNLKIFHFKGAHTEVLADGKVEDLLGDPLITFHTKSAIDLDALAKTFPLQPSVTIRGKLDANMGIKCRLSSLQKQDIGRMKLGGKLELKGFELKDAAHDFNFQGDASFRFRDSETLQAQVEIRKLMLRSKQLSSDIERLTGSVTSTNPMDTTRIVSLKYEIEADKVIASMGDSIKLYSDVIRTKGSLEPGKKDASKPLINFSLGTDSLSAEVSGNKLMMKKGGFKLSAEKVRDSLWMPQGVIGFERLRLRTPAYGLSIRMQKTAVTLNNNKITLKKASLRIGRSDITATGEVTGLYRALKKGDMLTARLAISSDMIDCNQLLNALSSSADTLDTDVAPTNEAASESMKLFIIPANINFELQTDLKKVLFDKMVFENVKGAVDIKNQAVHLKDLTMRALDSDMKAVMVYKATEKRGGYTGFDFKIENINVAKLVDFIPALDTIVPMLRSFKGHVHFDVAADARLDSMMNLRIPTLRAAMHVKGDSLVLMDGETFAEISKMLMFKNKKENVFDSIAVNVTVNEGNVIIYPFLVEIDRYKAAIGGRQGLDLNFDYHISILKSPLPFKAGVNITGNPDKMKFRIGKAKYKDAITPVEVHKVDSTRMHMGEEISNRFKRMMVGRQRSVKTTP